MAVFNQPKHGVNYFIVYHQGKNDQERRRIWIQRIRRKNWIPTIHSRLGEDHFTNDQYKQNRADGRRKLKPNSIPSIFHWPLIKQRKPPKQRVADSRQKEQLYFACFLMEPLLGKYYKL